MLRSVFFLIVMPFAIMYVLLLIYNILAMSASWEAFTMLSKGEKAATLLIAPFYLLEYIPIYIISFYRLKQRANRLGRERTAALRTPPTMPRTRLPQDGRRQKRKRSFPSAALNTKENNRGQLTSPFAQILNLMNLARCAPVSARSALLSALFSTKNFFRAKTLRF